MGKRARRLSLPKRRKPVVAAGETVVDTTQYLVEKIVGQTLKSTTLHYDIKWQGYPSSENTSEPEYRLNCDNVLLEHAVSQIEDSATYMDRIPKSSEQLYAMAKDSDNFLKFLDPISILAQTTIHGGAVKFVNFNTAKSKLKFLEYLIRHNQYHILHSACIPPFQILENSGKRYQKELDHLLELSPDLPKIIVRFPWLKKVPMEEIVFYPPPPLVNLVLEPVSQEMYEDRRKLDWLFPPKCEEEGFNKTQPFIAPSFFEKYPDHESVAKKERYDKMERFAFTGTPRFDVALQLVHQPARGWVLKADGPIDEGTPILLLAGVIRSSAVAEYCLREYGERVAFSSFIEIPGTEMCLDRSELHDFSKFIPHSCKPTCSVRLVNSGNRIPDLVVYSLESIDYSCSYSITLDYYKMFRKEVRQYFANFRTPYGKPFLLYDQGHDFVHCQCIMTKCPEVVYVTKNEEDGSPAPKKKKTEEVPPKKFGGIQLAESEKLWSLKNGKFEEY